MPFLYRFQGTELRDSEIQKVLSFASSLSCCSPHRVGVRGREMGLSFPKREGWGCIGPDGACSCAAEGPMLRLGLDSDFCVMTTMASYYWTGEKGRTLPSRPLWRCGGD